MDVLGFTGPAEPHLLIQMAELFFLRDGVQVPGRSIRIQRFDGPNRLLSVAFILVFRQDQDRFCQ